VQRKSERQLASTVRDPLKSYNHTTFHIYNSAISFHFCVYVVHFAFFM